MKSQKNPPNFQVFEPSLLSAAFLIEIVLQLNGAVDRLGMSSMYRVALLYECEPRKVGTLHLFLTMSASHWATVYISEDPLEPKKSMS